MQSDQNTPEMMGNILALDIGGSFIKSGLVSAKGSIVELATVMVDPNGSAAAIVQTIANVLAAGLRAADGKIDGIGISIPGPFDYKRGISLMTHKFSGINGIDLVTALREALPELATVPFRFRHDANSFLAGEIWQGAGRGYTRVIGVTLGTGIGVACYIEGHYLTNDLGSPAPQVSVWKNPYKDGIVEDYVSTRALVARYCEIQPAFNPAEGVQGISTAAQEGHPEARRLFAGFGSDLGLVLLPLCGQFQPEIIVVGGQIVNAFPLFEKTLKAELLQAAQPPIVATSKLGSLAALYGAVIMDYMV